MPSRTDDSSVSVPSASRGKGQGGDALATDKLGATPHPDPPPQVRREAHASAPHSERLRHAYRDLLVATFDRILSEQEAALDAVRAAIVTALAADRKLLVAGSGHSHMLAEEVFYRAGGIAAAQAVLDPALMLHESATRSTLLERESGRAGHVLARYHVDPGDIMVVVSNSGRNAYPIEMALAAKAQGAVTVALTSLGQSRTTPSRHASGKRLFEVVDHVLDNCSAYGDAGLPIPGRDVSMGPTSTAAGVLILNSLVAEAVAELAARGVAVDVYRSANTNDSAAENERILARWRRRMVGL